MRIDLGYVSEKLRLAVNSAYWAHHFCDRVGRNPDLVRMNAAAAFSYALVAFAELHGVVEVMNDRRLVDRLLDGSDEALQAWADRIAGGSFVERLQSWDCR